MELLKNLTYVTLDSVIYSVKKDVDKKTPEEKCQIWLNEAEKTMKVSNTINSIKNLPKILPANFSLEGLKNWMQSIFSFGTLYTYDDNPFAVGDWCFNYLETNDIPAIKIEGHGAELVLTESDTTTLILESVEVEELTKFVLSLKK